MELTTTCVQAPAIDIEDMIDAATECTYELMLDNCDDLLEVAYELGYTKESVPLALDTDYAVSFFKSMYQGQPCYYFVWSAIEHIFT